MSGYPCVGGFPGHHSKSLSELLFGYRRLYAPRCGGHENHST